MGAKQVSEPEVKFILFVLFLLGGLSTTAKSEAVLPAYLVGLVVAGVFVRDKTLVHRMRSIAFAIFTPFYFLKAGLYVSLPVIWSAAGIISLLLIIKVLSKYVGVFSFFAFVQHEVKGGPLYVTADEHRADVRYDLRPVRTEQQNHRPKSVHYTGNGGYTECRHPDPDCPTILSAHACHYARLGAVKRIE